MPNATKEERPRCEIARSYSYKMNIPGAYESRDFFCSQKAECYLDEAEEMSDKLYAFCRAQVIKAVAAEQAEMKRR